MLTGNWKLETQTGKSPISSEFPMAEGFAVNTRRVFYEVCNPGIFHFVDKINHLSFVSPVEQPASPFLGKLKLYSIRF